MNNVYQALYRKYRPLVFKDVAGQPHVTETLRRQVSMDKTSHAYLFTGSRGTGKTTCAKILARAVNCENPQSGDPCNACPSCRGILSGASTDVLEMDAASHSGVDNIRALREEFIYAPIDMKKRVYIIDEVHMLSSGAFNALLKSMEEPPEHVLFILATTETHKVPLTILSRCQRFAFRRIAPEDIAALLKKIAAAEGIGLTPEAAVLLGRMADGALRDGINLLDQCAAAGEGFDVDVPLVHEVLGLSGTLEMADWIIEIAAGDSGAVLRTLERLYQSGKDIPPLMDSLSTLLRDILMAHMLSDASSPRLDEKTVRALARRLSAARLVTMITAIQECQQRLGRSPNRRVEAELCLLRLCGLEAEKNVSAAQAADGGLGRNNKPGGALSKPEPPKAAPEPEPSKAAPEPPKAAPESEPSKAAPEPEPSKAAPEPPKAAPESEPSKAAPEPEDEDPLVILRQKCAPAYKIFMDTASARRSGNTLRITVPDAMAAMMLRMPDFTAFCEGLYPGTAVLIEEGKVQETPRSRLDSLKGRGGVITFEDDDE